jgi:hypothetical protein
MHSSGARVMVTSVRLRRFLFCLVFYALAAFGSTFLPIEDYQPSRPIYTLGLTLISGIIWASKVWTPIWFWSAGKILTITLILVFVATLFM